MSRASKMWVFRHVDVIWHNWAKMDQLWAWLHSKHRWAVGVHEFPVFMCFERYNQYLSYVLSNPDKNLYRSSGDH